MLTEPQPGSVFEQSQAMMEERGAQFRAQVETSRHLSPNNTFRVRIPLDTAQNEREPFMLGSAFKGVFAELDSSDTGAYVYIKAHGQQAHQDYIRMQDGAHRDFGEGVADAAIHWPAQAGKTIYLIFYSTGEFRNGKIISVNSGGVSINEGSAIGAPTQVTLVAATTAAIFPVNLNRKGGLGQNNTGGPIWIGNASVTSAGATKGIEFAPGERIVWKNTAALYAYSVAGGNIATVEET